MRRTIGCVEDDEFLEPKFLGVLKECRQYYGTSSSMVEGMPNINTIIITIESKIDFLEYLGIKRNLYIPCVYEDTFIRVERKRFKIF